MTDIFLHRKFRMYGWDVVQYYSYSLQQRNDPDLAIRNPMCTVFPTITSCSVPNVGASGVAQVHNGLCVLTQNIINEKIYLVLWWWYAILAPVSVLFIAYRIITIFFQGVRFGLLYRTVSLLSTYYLHMIFLQDVPEKTLKCINIYLVHLSAFSGTPCSFLTRLKSL